MIGIVGLICGGLLLFFLKEILSLFGYGKED